ncbi:MAG: hypothetical protein AAGA87_06960 [Pseudomonadota bacterium]
MEPDTVGGGGETETAEPPAEVRTPDGDGPPAGAGHPGAGSPSAAEQAASEERLAAEGAMARDAFAQTQTGAEPEADPEAIAADIISANTTSRNQRGGRPPVVTVNVEGIATDIVHMSRTQPELAGAVYTAAAGQVDAEQLEAAVNTQLQNEHLADASLLGDATPEPVDADVARAEAERLIEAHTSTSSTRRGTTRSVLDVNSMSYAVEQLAETDPSLAVAVRGELTGMVNADQAADMNRILSGGATWQENVEIAFENPVDGAIGALKGIANGFSAVGELFVRGSVMQSSAEQHQAAGWAALFGNDEMAAAHTELAEEMHDLAMTEDFVPEFGLDNRAQEGGETIGFVIDVAMAGKGIITGGAKVLARNADELAEAGARLSDEALAVADDLGDDLLRLGDDVPVGTHRRTAPDPADLDQADVDRFGWNHEQARPDLAEGVGTARADAVLDGEIRLPDDGDLGIDFYVGDAPVSLKGPLLNSATGNPIPINDAMVDGLANSVLKDMRLNTATDTIVVDTLGMTPLQRERLISTIETGMEALDEVKTVIYLE